MSWRNVGQLAVQGNSAGRLFGGTKEFVVGAHLPPRDEINPGTGVGP